jgi:hypothetical protein
MTENLFRDCGTLPRIYAKIFKARARQKFYFKPSETTKYEFQHTSYLLIKGYECEFVLNDHSSKGDFEIAIPQFAFNRMLSRHEKIDWICDNVNEFVMVSMKKDSKYTYKLINICKG